VSDKDWTPEQKFYDELTTDGKYKRIENCIYWLKHTLFVYTTLQEKNWIMTKPTGPGRIQVPTKELVRGLLQYYFEMHFLPKFQNERGTGLDMEKFLDLCIEHDTVKKLIANPTLFI
jgi:hypothetical protein